MTAHKRWTDAEKKIAQEFYGTIGTKKLSEALPGRTPRQIYDLARRMDLKKSHDRLREMGRELRQIRTDKEQKTDS